MNTSGMMEMGDPDNLPEKKGFFSRTRNTLRSNNSQFNNNKKNKSRRKQNLNSVRAFGKHGNGSTLRSYSKSHNLYGDYERSELGRYKVPRNSVAGKIRDALLSLDYLQNKIETGKSPLERQETYNQKVKNFTDELTTDKEQAEKAIFEYINKYMPFEGRSYIDNINALLQASYKAYVKEGGEGRILSILRENTGPLAFWGNILPADEEELKEIAQKYTSSLSNFRMKEEQNPMFAAPNASSFPIPNSNFKPLNTNGGGRRRKTRKTYKSKHTTRRNK
jgi:hypothetical protein